MQRHRPPSPQTKSVLVLLTEQPASWRHGYELCQRTGLKAGTLYPILIRLAERGWLETSWETVDTATGRPPRHLYRLTKTGLLEAQALEAEPAAPLGLRLQTGEAQ